MQTREILAELGDFIESSDVRDLAAVIGDMKDHYVLTKGIIGLPIKFTEQLPALHYLQQLLNRVADTRNNVTLDS